MAIRPTPNENFVCSLNNNSLSFVSAFVFTALCGVAWCVFSSTGVVFSVLAFNFQTVQQQVEPAPKKNQTSQRALCLRIQRANQNPSTASKQFQPKNRKLQLRTNPSPTTVPSFSSLSRVSVSVRSFCLKNDLRFDSLYAYVLTAVVAVAVLSRRWQVEKVKRAASESCSCLEFLF